MCKLWLFKLRIPWNWQLFSSREIAKEEVKEKGDEAIQQLSPIIKTSRVKDLILRFVFCNLSAKSEELLADAFAGNSFLAGFTCIQNPHNFDSITRDYIPSASVRKLEEAALHCKSPYLKIFQNEPLSRNISDLRSHYRSMHLQTIISRSPIYVALNELGLSKNILLDYSQKLISNGCLIIIISYFVRVIQTSLTICDIYIN